MGINPGSPEKTAYRSALYTGQIPRTITIVILTYQLDDYNTHTTLSVPLFSYSLVEQPVRLPPSAPSPAPPFRALRSTTPKRALGLQNPRPHNVIEDGGGLPP